MIPFIILFLIFVFVFLILSMFLENTFLIYFSSLVLILVGVYTMSNGLLNLNNWFTQSLSVAFLGIGMYLMVVISLNMIEEI
jgi:uncharacterized membrane protein